MGQFDESDSVDGTAVPCESEFPLSDYSQNLRKQQLMNGSSFPFRCSGGYLGEYCEMGLSQGVPPGTSKF